MEEIVNTVRFNLSYHPGKQRIYYTFKGFWPKDAEGREQEWKRIQNVERQLPRPVTALIDATQLKLMHPFVAEDVIRPTFKFLSARNVRGIAQVIDPKNAIAKMQFKRIITTLDGVNDRIHVFTSSDAAETWLDSLDRVKPKLDKSNPLQSALIYLIVPVQMGRLAEIGA